MTGKILPPTSSSKGEILARFLIVSLAATFGAIWKAMVNRRAVMRLSDLDDRLLEDIGVTRSDVHCALAEPYRVDPSHRLALRRLERKHTRQPTLTVVSGGRDDPEAAQRARVEATRQAA
ncbi:DUF1127 domain-containing protein [Salinarimonas ramus]|uniref:YjiS-like domain-containing protein n=1 Tax=Salinarimonas ramus TaxID=690164 RepID=A0A917QE99_9HYPH|nr:DUF1127 domain-containing protein [Salinarimonas ramus]GGK44604.1 hypothetical protein GCM10011322_34680 [Salinarimonas ramus]